MRTIKPAIYRYTIVVLLITIIIMSFNLKSTSTTTIHSVDDLNITEVKEKNYPAVICQSGKGDYSYRIYKAKEYIIIPDMYDDSHTLIAPYKDGVLADNGYFSTTKCTFRD